MRAAKVVDVEHLPPVEYEAMYYEQQMAPVMVAGVK